MQLLPFWDGGHPGHFHLGAPPAHPPTHPQADAWLAFHGRASDVTLRNDVGLFQNLEPRYLKRYRQNFEGIKILVRPGPYFNAIRRLF